MNGGLPHEPVDGASEGATFRAVAQASRRAPAAIAVAASAVLAVALLTKGAAPVVPAPIADVTPRLQSAEIVSQSAGPTIAATPSPTSVPPSRNPTVTPHPAFLPVPAKAGTTQLIPAGPTSVRLTIALPKGWQKASDAMYLKSNGVAPDGLSISAWHLLHVNTFPCRWASQAFTGGSPMNTAEGQASALSSWWGQDPGLLPYWNSRIAPLASKPLPTTLHGYRAWSVDVLIPSDFDFTQCDGGLLILWDTASGDVRYSLGAGEVHRLWVVDVGGEIIVIDATLFLSTSSADAARLQAIVDSAVIEP